VVYLANELIYKLQMFGVPIEHKVNMFIDNQSMCTNSKVPESVNKKKYTSISFHRAHETVAVGWLGIAHVPGDKTCLIF